MRGRLAGSFYIDTKGNTNAKLETDKLTMAMICQNFIASYLQELHNGKTKKPISTKAASKA